MPIEIPTSFLISVAFLFIAVLYYSRKKKPARQIIRELGFTKRELGENIAYGVAGFVAVFMLFNAILLIAESLGISDYAKNPLPFDTSSTFFIIVAVTMAPMAEELFFRGMLLEKFGFLFSSVAFAVAHFRYGSWVQIAITFTIGLVFCALARGRKSLVPSITAHFMYNLFFVLGTFS